MNAKTHPASIEGCALPAALEAVGEKWSFLILRAALNNIEHFEDFQAVLGIARNILSNRLTRLVDQGILARAPVPGDKRKVTYRLTQKGEELLPAMLALRQWGEKWMRGGPGPLALVDSVDGQPIRPITVQSHDGRVLKRSDLRWADGGRSGGRQQS